MTLKNTIAKLCSPAYFYLIVSVIGVIILSIQNYGNTKKYCVGKFSCIVPSVVLVFVFKLAFIAFWTFILDLLCKAGYTNISWILVLLPFILFAITFILAVVFGEKLMSTLSKYVKVN
jgi:hypothetical protein